MPNTTETLYQIQQEAERRARRGDPKVMKLSRYFKVVQHLAKQTVFDNRTLYQGNPVRNTNDLHDAAVYIMRDALLRANKSPQGEKA